MNEKIESAEISSFAGNGGYFPVLVKKEERLLVFFRTHAGHYGGNGKVSMSGSSDGLNWTAPVVVAEGRTDYRNPSAGILKDGSLIFAVLVYDVYHGEGGKADRDLSGNNRVVFYRSAEPEEGQWVRIGEIKSPDGSPYGRMTYYRDRLVMPYYESENCYCLASGDDGKTWNERNPIAEGYYEPAILNTGDGLIAALRGCGEVGFPSGTYITRSPDGERWTEPKRITERKEHPADLTLLSDGRI